MTGTGRILIEAVYGAGQRPPSRQARGRGHAGGLGRSRAGRPGIYSGFELCENRAVPGTEEYQDSETYEIRVRDWDAPGHIKPYIAKLNALRRAHPALQRPTGLEFHDADDDAVLFYGKTDPARADPVLVAVNLDFRTPRECRLRLPLDALGIGRDEPFRVLDLLRDTEHTGQGPDYRVRLDPPDEPAFIFSVRRR
jgi:starch synthase (maltosyl-transferring)